MILWWFMMKIHDWQWKLFMFTCDEETWWVMKTHMIIYDFMLIHHTWIETRWMFQSPRLHNQRVRSHDSAQVSTIRDIMVKAWLETIVSKNWSQPEMGFPRSHGGFSIKCLVNFKENHMKIDDLGVPLVLEISISVVLYHHDYPTTFFYVLPWFVVAGMIDSGTLPRHHQFLSSISFFDSLT